MTITQLERKRNAAFSELRKSIDAMDLQKGRGYALQGKISFQGLPISIEQERGSYREGTDANGREWRTLMTVPYGAIRATKANDGDNVDCYVGLDKFSDSVFVIHQNTLQGVYDEDKVILGAHSKAEAKELYLRHVDDPKYFGSIDEYDMKTFKRMLKERRGVKLKKSIGGYDMTVRERKGGRAERIMRDLGKEDKKSVEKFDEDLGAFHRGHREKILERCRKLVAAGKLSVVDAGLAESRLNKSMDLGEELYGKLGMKKLSKSSTTEQLEPFGVPVGSGNLAVNQPAGGVASQETTRAAQGEGQQRTWTFTATASGNLVTVTKEEVLHASHQTVLRGKHSTVQGGIIEGQVNKGQSISEETLREIFA